MWEQRGFPIWLLIVAMIVVPVVLALLFGRATYRRITPLSFRCRRCGGEFRQPPYQDFPVACPLCRAPDWNA